MEDSTDLAAQVPNGINEDTIPVTPPEHDSIVPESSQVTLPSTEVPPSPIEPNASFKTENNDDRVHSSNVIPSSLTPPPSSQAPPHNRNGTLPAALLAPRALNLHSPPATVLRTRFGTASHEDYVAPNPQQVVEATADELRGMLQACIVEHAKFKMEAAHHKLQYTLLNIQAVDDANRAEVEHEMLQRQIEALRNQEYSLQARREMSAATESAQLKYLHMKELYEDAADENETLARRFKAAKKLLAQKEDEIGELQEQRDTLLNRIRENREHFQMLTSPGGMLHGAMSVSTPKQHSTPQHQRTARQTPRSAQRESRGNPGEESMAALLQVLSQDNNSAPTTPTSVNRQVHRLTSKHTRNAQSLSSLPATPARHGNPEGLLPSADLVPRHDYTANLNNFSLRSPAQQRKQGSPRPQSEPQSQQTLTQSTSTGRKSRESTISAAEDSNNEELARQALESVAKSASFLSQASRGSQGSRRPLPNRDDEEEEVSASQASQAASDMLRRDPRESFEVAASRDASPRPAEKSARLQTKLLSDMARSGGEKRKLSGSIPAEELRQGQSSSPKKMRYAAQGAEGSRVGLGIQYGR